MSRVMPLGNQNPVEGGQQTFMEGLLCASDHRDALYSLSHVILTAAYLCKCHNPTSPDEDTEIMEA